MRGQLQLTALTPVIPGGSLPERCELPLRSMNNTLGSCDHSGTRLPARSSNTEVKPNLAESGDTAVA